MRDEGPSPEDIARFSDETGYCPSCGAEVWDGLSMCPKCGDHMVGGPTRRRPSDPGIQQRWIQLVVILVLLAFIIVFVVL